MGSSGPGLSWHRQGYVFLEIEQWQPWPTHRLERASVEASHTHIYGDARRASSR
jgi:hypothetical protein